MGDKSSFVLYRSTRRIVDILTDEEAGILFKAIFAYEDADELPEMDGATRVAFTSIQTYLDTNDEKYADICRKRREAVQKRIDKKKEEALAAEADKSDQTHQVISNDIKSQQDHHLISSDNKSHQTHQVISNDDDYESEYESESESDSDSESVSKYGSESDNEHPSGVSSSKAPAGATATTDILSGVSIPLPHNSSWTPTKEEYERMRESYPSLDVLAELNKMRAWCERGEDGCYMGGSVSGFVWRWLEREAQSSARKAVAEESTSRSKKGKGASADVWADLFRRVNEGEDFG